MAYGRRLAFTTLGAALLTTGCASLPMGGGIQAEAKLESRSNSVTSVVHRDPDDYATQPAGNSGPRIACGVIVAR